jgi:metal-responsive CopG/Arc/MetJ family transcriptional regulator
MKTVQIVLDEELLAELDRVARKRRASRSAFIRESVAQTLSALRIREQVEAERRAYLRRPQTADERAALRTLSRAQDRVLAQLGKKDRW